MPSSGENKLQTECLKYLDDLKIYRINLHGGGWCGKGSPDIIACICGRFVAFELKVGKNDMQPDQRIHRKKIMQNGGMHFTPRTISEFKHTIDSIKELYDTERDV